MVLVIIGLIIAGFLTGQDLIHAATIRSQISQIEKFNQAINTFQAKYGYLPGDIPASQAAQIGLATRSSIGDHGDGDGMIEGGGNNSGTVYKASSAVCGEVSLFWNDLSTLNLIEGAYSGIDANPFAGNCTATDPSTVIPKAKMGYNTYITVYGDPADGRNYYQIAVALHIDSIGRLDDQIPFYGPYAGPALTPIDASNIDTKIDDGQPFNGSVQARAGKYSIFTYSSIPQAETPAAPAAGVCVSTGNSYNINPSTGGGSLACSIRFRVN